MAKKFLSIILACCLVATCVFSLTGCVEGHTFSSEWTTNETHHWKAATCEHTEEKSEYGEHVYTDDSDLTCDTCSYERKPTNSATNEELSKQYKDIALALWESIGIEDPTKNQPQAVVTSAKFPEIKGETTDKSKIKNIHTNANTAAGIFYMISLLYENLDFELTDGVAYFDAVCSMTIGGQTIVNDYTFKIKPILDIANSLVKLELSSLVAGMTQYSYMEMNFDFDKNNLKSYKFYSMIVEIENIVGMSLTEDGKYLFSAPENNSDPFAVKVKECKELFDATTKNVEKLTGDYNQEMQTYFDVLSRAISEIDKVL